MFQITCFVFLIVFRRNIATNTHAWRPHFWFCVIFLANYTNYTNKSNKHVFIIILLDVYLKVHLLQELPDVQYLSTLNVGVRPKKYRTSSNFWAIFHARMQEFFGCFLPCKKATPKHTVLEGFFGIFFKKWPFYKSFLGCFYHVKKLVQNTMFWRGFSHFKKKKFTRLMPKSLNSMIFGCVR